MMSNANKNLKELDDQYGFGLKKFRLIHLVILILIILIVWSIFSFYSTDKINEDWTAEYEYPDRGYVAYSEEDFLNGRDCRPDNCGIVKTEDNTRVLECFCEMKNKTFRMIATERIKIQKYNWPDYKQQILNEEAEELGKDVIVLDEVVE